MPEISRARLIRALGVVGAIAILGGIIDASINAVTNIDIQHFGLSLGVAVLGMAAGALYLQLDKK